MAKYYFQKDAEMCYTLDYHRNYMKENGLKEMDVFEAKIEHGTGYFFCREFMLLSEVGESCGKVCEKYAPLNGKNGRCKHYGNVYEQLATIIKLTS